ncbi:MAG: hypothetical protein NC319_09775 [Butyricicoccus sp.]|nr:hypothetical protein [Butyricicoccus sp.]
MRHVKPALCALAALCLFALSACGGAGERGLDGAQEKLSNVGSLSCGVETDMGLSLAGESFNIKSSCRVDYTSEPAAVCLRVSTDMGRLGTSGYTAYAASSGGLYSAYIQLPGTWVRQDLSGAEALERYDIRLASKRWLGGAANVTDAGEEELDGQKVRRYDLAVSAKAVDGIMKASGAYEALSVLDITDAAARELLSGLGEIPLSVWVGEQGFPLRYELDLTGVMGALMDAVAGTLGGDYPAMTVEGLTVSLSLSDFDAVPAIEIPSEALGAQPLEGEDLF